MGCLLLLPSVLLCHQVFVSSLTCPAPAGPLRGCEGLLDFINTLARSLEAQAGEAAARAAHAQAARQLSEALLRLGGDVARANRLAKAYGVL